MTVTRLRQTPRISQNGAGETSATSTGRSIDRVSGGERVKGLTI